MQSESGVERVCHNPDECFGVSAPQQKKDGPWLPLQTKERACVFIDNSNLFWALRSVAEEIGDVQRLDYAILKEVLSVGRRADFRFYYSCKDEFDANEMGPGEEQAVERQRRFYRFLEESLQFQMIQLPLRRRPGYNPVALSLVQALRKRSVPDHEILKIVKQRPLWLKQIEGELVEEEKGLDCEIVYDMVRLSHHGHYDTFVLVAGDEDYARTVRKLRDETGVVVDVAFFGGSRCSTHLRRRAANFLDLSEIPELFRNLRKEED